MNFKVGDIVRPVSNYRAPFEEACVDFIKEDCYIVFVSQHGRFTAVPWSLGEYFKKVEKDFRYDWRFIKYDWGFIKELEEL